MVVNVAMLWSACISLCAWHFLLVYFLSKPVHKMIHWAIPTSARFLFRIFLWRLVDIDKQHYITVAILVKTFTIINSRPHNASVWLPLKNYSSWMPSHSSATRVNVVSSPALKVCFSLSHFSKQLSSLFFSHSQLHSANYLIFIQYSNSMYHHSFFKFYIECLFHNEKVVNV